MIQSGLFFALGFLVASFLALVVAPTIWRRAVFLTRKRIESAVPLTVNELQADKDKLRAEHAMNVRKVEMTLEKQRARNADLYKQLVEHEEDIKRLNAEADERSQINDELATEVTSLDEKLAETERVLQNEQFERTTVSAELAARTGEVESLIRVLQDAETKLEDADARIAEFDQSNEKLSKTIADLKSRRQADQAKVREAQGERRATAELLKTERAKAASFEKRYASLVSKSSDIEDKLDRREKEIARIKERKQDQQADVAEFEAQLSDIQEEKEALEKELAELTLQHNRVLKLSNADTIEGAFESLHARLAQREMELSRAKAESENFKKKIASVRDVALKQSKPTSGAAKATGDELLREQLNQLAAEVVHITAIVEGKASPINKILDSAEPGGAGDVISLADRIKALKNQAKAAE